MKLFWLRCDKKWNYFRDYFANFGEIIILTKKNKKKTNTQMVNNL